MILHLYHGRKTPDENLEDWGEDGPSIKIVLFVWTYSSLRIWRTVDGDFEWLDVKDDLIFYNGVYYGDFEIVQEDGNE